MLWLCLCRGMHSMSGSIYPRRLPERHYLRQVWLGSAWGIWRILRLWTFEKLTTPRNPERIRSVVRRPFVGRRFWFALSPYYTFHFYAFLVTGKVKSQKHGTSGMPAAKRGFCRIRSCSKKHWSPGQHPKKLFQKTKTVEWPSAIPHKLDALRL